MIRNKLSSSLWSYFRSLYKPYTFYIIFFIFFAVVLGLNGFVNSYLTKVIIDSLVDLNDKNLLLEVIFWPAVFTVLNFEIYSISWRAVDYIRLKTSPMIKNNIISHAFDHIHNQSQSFFHNSLSGAILNNINILAENIEKITNTIVIRIIRGIVQVSVAFVSMYFVNYLFALALLIWSITFVYISLKFSKKILNFSNYYAKSQSEVSGKIVDSISNSINVKFFARAKFESLNLQGSLSAMKEQHDNREWFLIKFHYIQGLSITCLMGIMVYLLIHLRINNQVTIGDFAFILGLSFYVTEYVWTLTEQVDQINDALGKCNQSFKALFQLIEVQDKANANDLVVSNGEIIFDKVHFNYNNTDALFQNKSVIITPKQKVGLVGCSGGGKTTFINLLLRLYDVQSGCILIDGQDIRNVTQNSLHNSIGVIPQDPLLFHRSLIENIRYGKIDSTDDEVVNAAKLANIHEFITTLQQGYNSLIGERGIKLSGGQRQRIALARVILKNAPILILDEATSQLDSITENTIKDSLGKFMQNKTTIIIAHRLSTLLQMDRILVFNQGRIVEDGSHVELLKAGKLYNKLWNSQIGDFLLDA